MVFVIIHEWIMGKLKECFIFSGKTGEIRNPPIYLKWNWTVKKGIEGFAEYLKNK